MTCGPSFLAAVRAAAAARRRPEDPVEVVPTPHHVVRLAEMRTVEDQRVSWDAADAWCRAHVNHAAGHQWSRRVDHGPGYDRRVPVFTFSDADTAFCFKMLF